MAVAMDSQEARRRMEEGRLYLPGDEAIMAEQMDCLEKQYDYNATRPHEQERRAALLREMFAQIGENCYIEPPLHANWGGRHVHFGSGVYANFNLTLVDDAHIYVGDCVVFGPNVTVATAGHPIEPGLRRQAMQYNADVRIGSNEGHPGGRGSRGLPLPCAAPHRPAGQGGLLPGPEDRRAAGIAVRGIRHRRESMSKWKRNI